MNTINENIEMIRMLCKKHNVSSLFVFGSILTNDFQDSSDIDFIVDFKGVEVYNYADNYFDLKTSLENLLQRQIDLLEEKAIKNPYFRKSISLSKQKIYG